MELNKNQIGTYVISNNAFKDIVKIILEKTENIMPAKKNDYVLSRLDKNNDLSLTLALRIKPGLDLLKLVSSIQNTIKENILLMTNVECKIINIDIQGFIIE